MAARDHSTFERHSRADQGGFPEHLTVAERRRSAREAIDALRARGEIIAPVELAGRAIAAGPFGRALVERIESLPIAGGRLASGRSYVRSGSVIDLKVREGVVHALVCGSELYRVRVRLREPTQATLFAEPSQLEAHCSCPDDDPVCKHAAAALYAVAARLDADPALRSELRAMTAAAR